MNNIESTISNKNKPREFWLTHVKQWQDSKLSQPVYCQQAGIQYGTFVYWRSMLKAESKPQVKSQFVPVKITNTNPVITEPPRSIQIKLLSGYIVYIPMNIDVKEIALLIHKLGMPHA